MIANQTEGLNTRWGLGWMLNNGQFGNVLLERNVRSRRFNWYALLARPEKGTKLRFAHDKTRRTIQPHATVSRIGKRFCCVEIISFGKQRTETNESVEPRVFVTAYKPGEDAQPRPFR